MPLTCEVVTELPQWEGHAAEIRDLVNTSRAVSPFTSHAWLTSWWKAFGTGCVLRIGLFRVDGRLVGYAPLMSRTTRFYGIPFKELTFIGEGLSDHADLFSMDDDENIKQEMLDIILGFKDWDIINLNNIHYASNTPSAMQHIKNISPYVSITSNTGCPYIDIGGKTFEEYYATKSSKRRSNIRTRERGLSACAEYEFVVNPSRPPIDLYNQFKTLHSLRAEEKGWSSMYDDGPFKEFMLTILDRSCSDFDAIVSFLIAGDHTISYRLGFVMNNTYYSWNGAFDRNYDAYAPGTLHYKYIISKCFDDKIEMFDMLRGTHQHKMFWSTGAHYLSRIFIVRKFTWRWPLNRIVWMKERAPGSLDDHIIHFAKSLLKVFKITRH
jgi:CelD/BcsL family acetyltransferase involved in cellulose biosynthesis